MLAQRPAATPVSSFAQANTGNPIRWERMGFCLGEVMRKKCHTLWAEVFCLLDRRTSNERIPQLGGIPFVQVCRQEREWPPSWEKRLPDFGDAIFLDALKTLGGDVGAVVGPFESDFLDRGVGVVTGDLKGFPKAGHGENAASRGFEGV